MNNKTEYTLLERKLSALDVGDCFLYCSEFEHVARRYIKLDTWHVQASPDDCFCACLINGATIYLDKDTKVEQIIGKVTLQKGNVQELNERLGKKLCRNRKQH